MSISDSFARHLESGATTLCRAWVVERRDGAVLGFTDHDRELTFEGIRFAADSGLTAHAMSHTTGLSVDNSEALGVLSHAAITEADIAAGRYDGAEVRAWLVNWANPDDRVMQFRGSLGEITRAGGAFRVELRGLSEALNQPVGFVYQRPCSAVLGDGRCKFDLSQPGYTTEIAIDAIKDRRIFRFNGENGFEPRWFESGRMEFLDGAAVGLVSVIKNDRFVDGVRVVELWQAVGPEVVVGDQVRLVAGCDRRSETCKLKFDNFLNFRGFPHIPGEDWLLSYPVQGGSNDGGSLY